MRYRILLVSDAEEDLFEIFKYVSLEDSVENAEKIIREIEEKCKSLADFPDRGHIPPELARIGVFDFHEIHYKFCRVIYQVIESNVFIHCILDSRRDLQELLENRLLR